MSTKKSSKWSIWDLVVIGSFPFIATAVTIIFSTSQIVSLFFFFIIPSLYLSIRQPSLLMKGGIIALSTIPFTIIVDFFAIQDGSWWVETIFPFRYLNGIPVEDFIWCATWFYYVIAIYETFIDRSQSNPDTLPSKRSRTLILGWFLAGCTFLLIYPLIKNLTIPYFYALFTFVIGLIPLIFFLIRYPKLWRKFSVLALWLFFVNILHEISALTTHQWYFPGHHFIGWVQIFSYHFPIEEFMLWMMLGAMYLLAWYEYFVDDQK